MANNETDKKTMDVSKPGKVAADATARPVIVGHRSIVQDPMVKPETDVSELEPKKDDEVKTKSAPTSGEKVIEPLNKDTAPELSDIEQAAAAAVSKSSKNEAAKTADKEEKTAPASESSETTSPAEASSEASQPKSADSSPDEVLTEEKPKEPNAPNESPTKTPDTPKDSNASNVGAKPPQNSDKKTEDKKAGSSEAAEVDAIANQAGNSKQKEKQEAEQEAAKQAHLQKLIDDKKYFVKTGQVARRRNNRIAIVLLVLLILIVGAYLAIDAKLLKVGFNVPIHIINN